MKSKSKFRQWLEDAVIGFYFRLTGMTEQEYWERASMFCPTPLAPDGANVCRVIEHVFIDGSCAMCGASETRPAGKA